MREEKISQGIKTGTLLFIATAFWVVAILLYFAGLAFPAFKKTSEGFFFASIPVAFWMIAIILIKINKLQK